MAGWLLAACAALAIIPTTNRDRALSARTLRDPEHPSVLDVKVEPGAVEAARKTLSDRRRIAVLPFSTPAGGASLVALARGCSGAITDDLHYARALLVLDPSEVVPVLRGGVATDDPAALAEVGRKLGARYLVIGSVTPKGAGIGIDARLVEVGPGGSNVVAHSDAAGPADEALALADSVLLGLLTGELASGPEAEQRIKKVPTGKEAAIAKCEEAVALLEKAENASKDEDDELTDQARKLTDQAIRADSRYLKAALYQASCLARLGRKDGLKESLRRVNNLRNPEQLDELTRLELSGDYRVFAKSEFDANTLTPYEEMLAIDPTHLHALWMLTALHSGDGEYGPAKGPAKDPKKAAGYAARLVAAHPNSPAAKFLTRDKP